MITIFFILSISIYGETSEIKDNRIIIKNPKIYFEDGEIRGEYGEILSRGNFWEGKIKMATLKTQEVEVFSEESTIIIFQEEISFYAIKTQGKIKGKYFYAEEIFTDFYSLKIKNGKIYLCEKICVKGEEINFDGEKIYLKKTEAEVYGKNIPLNFSFPLKSRGFIFPAISISKRNGLILSIGYIFPIFSYDGKIRLTTYERLEVDDKKVYSPTLYHFEISPRLDGYKEYFEPSLIFSNKIYGWSINSEVKREKVRIYSDISNDIFIKNSHFTFSKYNLPFTRFYFYIPVKGIISAKTSTQIYNYASTQIHDNHNIILSKNEISQNLRNFKIYEGLSLLWWNKFSIFPYIKFSFDSDYSFGNSKIGGGVSNFFINPSSLTEIYNPSSLTEIYFDGFEEFIFENPFLNKNFLFLKNIFYYSFFSPKITIGFIDGKPFGDISLDVWIWKSKINLNSILIKDVSKYINYSFFEFSPYQFFIFGLKSKGFKDYSIYTTFYFSQRYFNFSGTIFFPFKFSGNGEVKISNFNLKIGTIYEGKIKDIQSFLGYKFKPLCLIANLGIVYGKETRAILSADFEF